MQASLIYYQRHEIEPDRSGIGANWGAIISTRTNEWNKILKLWNAERRIRNVALTTVVLKQKCILESIFVECGSRDLSIFVTSNNVPPDGKVVFCFLWFCSSSLFFLFVYWFTWLPSVSLCLLTLSVLGSQTLIKVSHSRACALCETKLGIGCAVMFMHLKISCCSAFCSISSNSWNLGFVHTHSCLGLTYSNKVYKYLETDTFGYFGGNGGVFLWEHVTLLCNRMLQ